MTNPQTRSLLALHKHVGKWVTCALIDERRQSMLYLCKHGYAERRFIAGDKAEEWKITTKGIEYVAGPIKGKPDDSQTRE